MHCVVDKISILRLLSAALLQPKKSRFDRKWPLISGWCIFESFHQRRKIFCFSLTRYNFEDRMKHQSYQLGNLQEGPEGRMFAERDLPVRQLVR